MTNAMRPSPVTPAEFLACWDVGPTSFAPLTGGEIKTLWRVNAETGVFVLRVYPAAVAPRAVALECRWLEALARVLPEVQPPIPASRNGSPFVIVDSRIGVLTSFVDGATPDLGRREHRRACARVLARIHRASESLDDQRGDAFFPPMSRLDFDANPFWELRAIERRLAREPLWQLVARRLDDVHRIIDELADLPAQAIHNDFGPDNILLGGDEVRAVIDWDWATIDWRAFDLADAARGVARSTTAQSALERLDEFLSEYQVAGGMVTDREIAALPTVIWLRLIWTACYDLGRACAGSGDAGDLEHRKRTIEALERHSGEAGEWGPARPDRPRG